MALKVMFVDDDPSVLELFKALVEPLGYQVLTFADSRDAAQQVMEEKFDGVFLDAHMPHPDGFEMAQIIRNSPSNFATPIAMLTGDDGAEAMRRSFQAGATSFMGKPFTQSRLAKLMTAMRGVMVRDKKRCSRLPLRTTVTCKMGNQRFKSCSLNISTGGMMLEKSGGATVGQELDLEFMMPRAPRPLKAHVKVIRKERSDQIGVEFLHLGTQDLKVIEQYINKGIKQ